MALGIEQAMAGLIADQASDQFWATASDLGQEVIRNTCEMLVLTAELGILLLERELAEH